MTTWKRGPALTPDPHPTPATAPSTRSTTSVVQAAARLPGNWPDAMHSDDLRDQWMREHARRELVTNSIRCHIAEQPNPRAARLTARRWINDIHYITDGVIAAMNQEHE